MCTVELLVFSFLPCEKPFGEQANPQRGVDCSGDLRWRAKRRVWSATGQLEALHDQTGAGATARRRYAFGWDSAAIAPRICTVARDRQSR
jgi:hypothetical protein